MRTRTIAFARIGVVTTLVLSFLALVVPGAHAAAGGPLVLMGIDAEDCGPGGHGPISVYGDAVQSVYSAASSGSGILVIGAGKGSGPDNFWNAVAADTGLSVTFVTGAAAISAVDFSPYRMLAVVSDQYNTCAGLTEDENQALTDRKVDVANFINAGGGLIGFTSDFVTTTPYGYLGDVGSFTVTTFQNYENVEATPEGEAIGLDDTSLDLCCWHDYYDAFPSFLDVLAIDPNNNRVAAIGGVNVQVPVGITLDPATDTNPVGTSHTVTATVEDTNGTPQPGVQVDFSVIGGSSPNQGEQSGPGECAADPNCSTDANGQTSWTYTSNGTPGTDTIQACFTDPQGQRRCATAEKVWEGEPAPDSLVLDPKTATNTAGDQHCVTATVTAGGNPSQNVSVVFDAAGANTASGSDTSDAAGEAQFCYTGTTAGDDTITAFADTDGDGTQDAGEPSDTAAKTWTAASPAGLVLTPETATNTVDDQHCVTATITDEFGNPTPGVTAAFSVTGPGSSSGTATTDADGRATYCYTSPLPGDDTITAFADTDGDGTQDAGEPSDTAAKTWTVPTSNDACKVTDGGRILAANGDKATFGANAQVGPGGLKGQQQYTDHGPATPMNVHSSSITALVCREDGTASIFGAATVDGSGVYDFRVDVKDGGEPSVTDTYRIRLSNGYDSGNQPLRGGNIQIH